MTSNPPAAEPTPAADDLPAARPSAAPAERPPIDAAARNLDLRFVLVRTSHPGNIGSAARAIRTMGFTRLHLVAPQRFPHADASAMAAGADDVLAEVAISATLEEALADCTLALGCTARQRAVQLEELPPAAAAERLVRAAPQGPVALVFGNERTGLENSELQLCHAAVHIPSAADFPSLNLAQAVQLLAWEVRRTLLAATPTAAADSGEALATVAQLEHFFAHLAQTLDDIDFHKGRSPVTIMKRLRRLFLRTGLEQREVRILRGIFDDAQRMAKAAKAARAGIE